MSLGMMVAAFATGRMRRAFSTLPMLREVFRLTTDEPTDRGILP